ncbi:DUF1540 domain-containing protein [Caldisalinibacter kiritimatiensis]|uniref:DUF1540 domain-containing protein n=1 Tax=Caldisalinibacter kiritimatiensis TaxID=1304284 RepID=R1CYE6_9FIRM|nr:DUF1540 domain-containing protein [Caldisalinibacter kiritimatiensis]EOD01599.1 protein of unknown function DUF1540 [Caldisalinibacter kiritimatiensis]
MHVNNSDEHIHRVKCTVNTCQYYAEGDYCTAPSIEIQPRNAKDTQETDCATFRPYQGMRG